MELLEICEKLTEKQREQVRLEAISLRDAPTIPLFQCSEEVVVVGHDGPFVGIVIAHKWLLEPLGATNNAQLPSEWGYIVAPGDHEDGRFWREVSLRKRFTPSSQSFVDLVTSVGGKVRNIQTQKSRR